MVWQSYGKSKIVSHCAAVIGYDTRIMFFLLRYITLVFCQYGKNDYKKMKLGFTLATLNEG
jgi:hypothetical protein